MDFKLNSSLIDGIDKYGWNGDIDAAEDFWSGGGAYPWSFIGTNGVVTVDSTSAEDGAGTLTGALTLEIEGLKQVTKQGVTGGQIFRELITMDGTDAVTAVNQYSCIYRARVRTAGSNKSPVGLITILIGANVVARLEVGNNQTEMAIMVVPQFNSLGTFIHGAYVHNWGASIVANSAANMGVALSNAPKGTETFAVQRRGVCTVNGDVNQVYHGTPLLSPGTRVKVHATSVSATNQVGAGYFTLEYKY